MSKEHTMVHSPIFRSFLIVTLALIGLASLGVFLWIGGRLGFMNIHPRVYVFNVLLLSVLCCLSVFLFKQQWLTVMMALATLYLPVHVYILLLLSYQM